MQVISSGERPDLEPQVRAAFWQRWPEFIFHGEAGRKYLPYVTEHFGHFDILLLDSDQVAAGGWGVPFAWDGTIDDLPDGYDGALARSVSDHQAGTTPTALSFMAAAVAPAYDKQGLATQVLQALSERAAESDISSIVAPLRPTLKHRYPLQPMSEFAAWTRADGLSIDPWIRTHQRMGATILGPACRSMVISGSVAEWESWADMRFPTSGEYVIPDGLNILTVDRDSDVAIYVEENLWVRHR